MIPYVTLPNVVVGGVIVPLYPLLVIAGLWTGYRIFLGRVARMGCPVAEAQWFFVGAVGCGFVGAHIVKLVVYEYPLLRAEPARLLMIFSGLSSFGGFLGAVVGAWLVKRRLGISDVDILRYADAALFAAPFGWLFGRAACALTHDHVGRLSQHWLAVQYPGGARWNLGLVEFFYVAVMAAVFAVLARKPRVAGFYPAAFCFFYAPFRFWLDGLHETDPVPSLATPDRLGALLMLGCGCVSGFAALKFRKGAECYERKKL